MEEAEAAQVVAAEEVVVKAAMEATEMVPMAALFQFGSQSLVVSVPSSLLLSTFTSAKTVVETKHCLKKL